MKLLVAAGIPVCHGVLTHVRSFDSSNIDALFESSTQAFNAMIAHSSANLDATMTIDEAVNHVASRSVPNELKVALSNLGVRGTAVEHLVGKVLATEKQPTTALVVESDKPKINEVLVRIFKIINGMIVEDQNKLVVKVFECLKQHKGYTSQYRT
eukprot:CAMPEP_0204393050 /NCGR_PEP_ID=MMETSP0469-20131031/62110_1 /ASSEMBLY_ACC=CAM_ASM_000384 /TAXON_ID=2969 /ORGANISM="Oxyrrhis marina" /LENGTH=154 /DNA_ID=CAMNT_0051387093 /DNA_START=122 /DNA_END=582 /DNA_ORIENTATION=+